jgi:hypothetical protein
MVPRHLARSRKEWDTRRLLFIDNLTALGCMRRMRARSVAMLRLLRRIGAVTLAVGIRVIARYVPTAVNFADGPSHGEAVGIARKNRHGAGPPPG